MAHPGHPQPGHIFHQRFQRGVLPDPRNCTAVGSSFDGLVTATLAEVWNGSVWRIQTAAIPTRASNSTLLGLSCWASVDCTAVGSYDNGNQTATFTLAERWNGSTWADQTTPNPARVQESYLDSTSCAAPGRCIAVGYYALSSISLQIPLAEIYNG